MKTVRTDTLVVLAIWTGFSALIAWLGGNFLIQHPSHPWHKILALVIIIPTLAITGIVLRLGIPTKRKDAPSNVAPPPADSVPPAITIRG
jgi:hypothetical protein